MPTFQDNLATLTAPLSVHPEPAARECLFQGTLAQFERLHARNPLAAEGLLRPLTDMSAEFLEKSRQLGNLVKKQITDSTGKKTTVWVKANGDELGTEDRKNVGQKPTQPAAAAPPQHPSDKLHALAEEAPTDKLLEHAGNPNNPRAMRNAAKHALQKRGVDVAQELAKQPKQPNTKTAESQASKLVQDSTKESKDSDAAKAAPLPGQPKIEPGKVAPGSAPGTPAGWEGDTSFPEDVRKAYDTNLKGIVKTVDKMVVGNAVTGIIYGEGGAGKTYNVEKTLKARGMVPMQVGDKPVKNGYLKITGKITPKAVYETLYRYKDNLIIFDDCDSALANADVVNMFKGALDTAEQRMVARVTPEGAKKPAAKAPAAAADTSAELKALTKRVRAGDQTLTDEDRDRWHALKTGKAKPAAAAPAEGDGEEAVPNQFEFKGKVLFITNKKPDPVALQPILSRGGAHNATMNRQEMLFAMSKNLPFIGVRPDAKTGKQPVVPFQERQQIYDFIKDNEALFPDLTMRHFGQVYEDKKYAEATGTDWQQEVKETLEAQNKEKASEEPATGTKKKSFDQGPDFVEKGLEVAPDLDAYYERRIARARARKAGQPAPPLLARPGRELAKGHDERRPSSSGRRALVLVHGKHGTYQQQRIVGAQSPPKGKPTLTFSGEQPVTGQLGGVKFAPWADVPQTPEQWAQVDGQDPYLEEPPLPELGKKGLGSGVIIREKDGRVWLVKPTKEFGGYKHTFPKGGAEEGLSLQANAIKETFEEAGLKVKITGYAGDVERDTSVARYYYAERTGGTPSAHGWESEAVVLVDPLNLHQYLNKPVDQQLAHQHAGAPTPPPPPPAPTKAELAAKWQAMQQAKYGPAYDPSYKPKPKPASKSPGNPAQGSLFGSAKPAGPKPGTTPPLLAPKGPNDAALKSKNGPAFAALQLLQQHVASGDLTPAKALPLVAAIGVTDPQAHSASSVDFYRKRLTEYFTQQAAPAAQ